LAWPSAGTTLAPGHGRSLGTNVRSARLQIDPAIAAIKRVTTPTRTYQHVRLRLSIYVVCRSRARRNSL